MGMDQGKIDISVIIPVYNTEMYLERCVDSLKNQKLELEIIMIDDGSTDGSGIIADELSQKDRRIKLIRQENRGLAAARNRGMDEAKGKYIFFLDSDDWIKDQSLEYLYTEVSKHDADVVMGNTVFCYPDGQINNPYGNIIKDIIGTPLTGKQCFIELMKSSSFAPMACNYICRRAYLENHHFRFEDVIHEDEIWTPIILGSAQKALITNFDFYYYRQRVGSITHDYDPVKRLHSLFFIADRLLDYAEWFSFIGNDQDFKSWLYVKIFELYYFAFTLLPKIKDSSVILPPHRLYDWEKIKDHLTANTQNHCVNYFTRSIKAMEEYEKWLQSAWVVKHQKSKDVFITFQILKKGLISVLMPVYNASAYLPEAMDSVLQQTFADFELIIVDDGSTDNSTEIIMDYHDERIRIILNTHDFISSLNKGIEAASGTYIARMDADDIMLPHRLESQFHFMEDHPDIDICGSWAENFGTGRGVVQTIAGHQQIISSLLLSNQLTHPTVMMRRSIFVKDPELRYPEGYPCAEDYKLWTILAGKGFRFANIPEVLLRYRRSSSQVTERNYHTMHESAFRIQMEYAEQVMAQMVEKEERYFDFFDQLVGLSNDRFISVDGLLHTVYHAYTQFLKHDNRK